MENKKVIVSVCRGNIVRSVVAQAVIQQQLEVRGIAGKYESLSRGIQGTSIDPQPVKYPNITYYGKLYEDAKPIFEKFGINVSEHVSTPIDENIAKRSNILLAMDMQTRDALIRLFPDQKAKVYLLSKLIGEERNITDPEGVSGQQVQEAIFTQIQDIITKGFPRLLQLISTELNN